MPSFQRAGGKSSQVCTDAPLKSVQILPLIFYSSGIKLTLNDFERLQQKFYKKKEKSDFVVGVNLTDVVGIC